MKTLFRYKEGIKFNSELMKMEKVNFTFCELTDEDKKVYFAHTICSPDDKFVKATGRKIAKGRAYSRQLKGYNRISPFTNFTKYVNYTISEHNRSEKYKVQKIIKSLTNLLINN